MIADTVNPFLAMRASIDAIRRYNSTNRDGQRIRTVLIPGMGHGMIGRMPVHRVAHQIRRAYEIRALGTGLKMTDFNCYYGQLKTNKRKRFGRRLKRSRKNRQTSHGSCEF